MRAWHWWTLAGLAVAGLLLAGGRAMNLPRGIRNNNPGNIREGAGDVTRWQGERVTDDDPAFEEFDTPEAGIRALARVLLKYQSAYGLRSVRQMITRWAPPSENDTGAYVATVARAAGVGADDAVDLYARRDLLRAIVTAIIRHENGQQPYSVAVIDSGINAAFA